MNDILDLRLNTIYIYMCITCYGNHYYGRSDHTLTLTRIPHIADIGGKTPGHRRGIAY